MNWTSVVVLAGIALALLVIAAVIAAGVGERRAERGRRKVEAKWRERADPVHHIAEPSEGSVTHRRVQDPQYNLLNPVNPSSPLNQLNLVPQIWQPEPTREDHRNDCQNSYQSPSSSSSSSSDSCSSSSSSD